VEGELVIEIFEEARAIQIATLLKNFQFFHCLQNRSQNELFVQGVAINNFRHNKLKIIGNTSMRKRIE
jgi:hypothetical protein